MSTLNNQSVCVSIQGNCIDRADTAGCNGRGWNDEDVSYTLNTIDRHAVMCLNDQGGGKMSVTEDMTNTLRSQTNHHEPLIIEMTSTKNTVIEDGICCTLTARMGTGGNQVNAVCAGFLDGQSADARSIGYEEEISPTLRGGGDTLSGDK